MKITQPRANDWHPPSGAVSGDLGGGLPGPTVTGIQGVPVDAGAATPADRDVLIFDAASGTWVVGHQQAIDVDYDPTASGLTATDVQAAIDEVVALASTSPMVPYFIASGDTFTIPLYKQALFNMAIVNDGTLVVDGYLILVT